MKKKLQTVTQTSEGVRLDQRMLRIRLLNSTEFPNSSIYRKWVLFRLISPQTETRTVTGTFWAFEFKQLSINLKPEGEHSQPERIMPSSPC